MFIFSFSTLTYTLTNDMENAFSTPQSIDYTQAGMGFSLTSQEWATSSTVQSPSLYRNFDQYISNCVLPGVSTGNLSVNTVDNSTDLLTDWAAYTSGLGSNLITTWYSETGGVSAAADGGTTYPAGYTTSCGVETNWIDQAMSYYIQQDLGPQEAGMLNETWTQYQSLLGDVNSGVYGISQSSTQYLMQATAANQFNTAMLDLAKMSGVNANGLAYGTALAQSTQTSQFTMSGILAGRYMPVVYGVMFAIFTGASLLLLLLMLLPHPMQYIKMYLELLLWLTIWPALMAVYNFIVDLIIQWQSSGYLSNYYTTPHGIVLSNVHALTNWVQTSLAWVGYLSWSIPMLSYAIVSGSAMAMTSMVGSMDSAVGGGVSSGASQVGSGNVSFGSMTARDMRIDDVASGNTKSNMYTDNVIGMNNVSEGNTSKNNLSSGNVNKNGTNVGGISESIDGNTVNGTTSNAGLVGSILGQKGLSGTKKAEELAASGAFTGTDKFTGINGDSVIAGITPGSVAENRTTKGLSNRTGIFSRNGKRFVGTQTGKIGSKKPVLVVGTSGQNLNSDNINNSTFSRFKKHLKGYENLNEGLNENVFGSRSWQGNTFTTDNSRTSKSGHFYETPSYTGNQAFLDSGSYIHNFAKYSPGGAGIISGMKNKDTGSFGTFNQKTQDMMQQYGGNINQLTFSAKVTDEIEAKGGLSFLGSGIQDKFKASVGVDGQSMMQANTLRTETGNQLTKYGDEYKSGKISWSQYQKDANGLVAQYKTLVNIGSTPSVSVRCKSY